MIEDYSSDNNSIENYSHDGLDNINDEIMKEEHKALVLKRQNNTYDIIGILDEDNKLKSKIQMLMNQGWKEIKDQHKGKNQNNQEYLTNLESALEKEVYSENIKIYTNKTLKNATMVIFRGYIYVYTEEKSKLFLQAKPISLLDDIQKVVYCEDKDKLLAF
jgi:hypothetical protein